MSSNKHDTKELDDMDLGGGLSVDSLCVSKQAQMMYLGNNECKFKNLHKCFRDNTVLVADTFTSFIDNTDQIWQSEQKCNIMFLQRNSFNPALKKNWPQMEIQDDAYILYISRGFLKWNHQRYILYGENCTTQLEKQDETTNGSCQKRCLDKSQCNRRHYDEYFCSNHGQKKIRDRFVINITATEANCISCYTPVKVIDAKIVLNTTLQQYNFPDDGNKIDPSKASVLMQDMARLVSSSNESTIAVSAGEGVTGILQKTEPLDPEEISFAYSQSTDDLQIIQDKQLLPDYLRSITVSKEAFEKAISTNISEPFVAVFRFLNMGQDEQNSTVLGDEVVAVEMGRTIKNLTDTININFLETDYVGTPHCNSWDGKGSWPNWTDEGCETVTTGRNITCRCSHLTFFAILLTPPDEISSSDLNTLTIITQAGCGISMFFLGIVLFMHCLLRKGKATKATTILIHLVLAMFFLNFTFLTNNFVAKTKNDVGCKIMAALMHYFMLATLTLFAVQAFHICLQLYKGGRIDIHHYILKVSIISWVIPSIIAVVLFSTGNMVNKSSTLTVLKTTWPCAG
ncbi:hypothetical protein INR49_001337 [Caranx melampygus]|nr:hypothetical protein INR49_001337 [Caranx melampygus]